MFTGIIEEKGTIAKVIKGSGTYKLVVSCEKVLGKNASEEYEIPTQIGDSIAVNGICLTVTELTESTFTCDVMPETLSRTSLNGVKPGTPVNLERAMPAYGRFGGHFVSGHIDGTGKVTSVKNDGNAVWYEISTSREIAGLIVEKGSIAIDGISLTVAEVSGTSFKVSIIPHTIEETILPYRKAGSIVNLENDVIGKYTKKIIENKEEKQTVSDRGLLELL